MAVFREVFIVRIGSDPVALFHTAFGKLLIPADSIIGPDPAVAIGTGQLISIPDLELLINGTAERISIDISGVDEETVALALDESESVAGATLDIGRMDFDVDWQQVGSVEWEGSATVMSMSIARQRVEGFNKAQRVISLQIAAGSTRRARAPMSFFTDADQRRKSPTDAIFSHVGQITAGTSRRFGPSDA